MSRLRGLSRDELDDEQLELWNEIVESRSSSLDMYTDSGSLSGPFNGFVHVPALGRHWAAIGAHVRFASTLPDRVVELAICTVGASFRADYEFLTHAPLAARAGISASTIGALRDGRTPAFDRDDERVTYQTVDLLLAGERISNAAYAEILTVLGPDGPLELVSLVGYYTSLAMMINLFEIDPPRDTARAWP